MKLFMPRFRRQVCVDMAKHGTETLGFVGEVYRDSMGYLRMAHCGNSTAEGFRAMAAMLDAADGDRRTRHQIAANAKASLRRALK